MKDYIEREAAIAAAFSATSLRTSAFRDVYDTVNRLRLIPAVDAVEVVRCGECRRCATDDCGFFAHGEWGMSGPDWDFFCADGKRKGGDE